MPAPWSQEVPCAGLQREPHVGDVVHIAGHGPATVRKLAARSKFEVMYPNGDTAQVDRHDILVHEGSPLPNVCTSPTGPRRLEYFGRAFDDASRTIRTPSATFSLVATMVGGGVLSLPYAMSQCGLVLGTLVLALSALASVWTLDMLVSCARCTGRDTFELVGHAAFGEGCRKLTVTLVFCLTWLAQVAYFVLVQDLLAPMALLIAPGVFDSFSDEGIRRLVVTLAAVLLAPMCYKGSLSALRFLCFASVGSVVMVGIILGVKAVTSLGHRHEIEIMDPDKSSRALDFSVTLTLWPETFLKALYVVPMFGVSFLCHFNALPTHQELQRPTRQRMQRVLKLSMCFTTLLYLFVGISGYAWAGSCTCGNILLNFARDDPAVALGRVALGLVLMMNFPLLVQPCRNTLFRLLVAVFGLKPASAPDEALGADIPPPAQLAQTLVMVEEDSTPTTAAADAVAGGSAAEPGPPRSTSPPGSASLQDAARSPSLGSTRSRAQVHAYRREDARGMLEHGSTVEAVDIFEPKDETVQQSAAEPSLAQRCILTTGILMSSLLLSMFMQSILVVWSVLGSTVAFMIAFILPAAFWYRLVGPRAKAVKRRAVAALLVFFTVLALVCTVMTVLHLDAPPCPKVGTPFAVAGRAEIPVGKFTSEATMA
eukprot:CAMPEP_0170249956 /NCGR_PEP_ID=MMETSP0116_2-20130129/24790_1 /TAXON_ID=400756 /ORGANISM="Durinskia baltica, Strain CSIRO CS-38" /LENGTH=653 /DNA_ID=CAMNT_0010500883 /DNA_START=74 /DNA_END=2035 /DNA_ORIENTATION=+